MSKRILSLLLALVIVFSLLPSSVLAAEIDEEDPAGAEDVVLAPASPERGGVSEADGGVSDNAADNSSVSAEAETPSPQGEGNDAAPASPERGGASEADGGVTPADANDPVGDGVLDVPSDDNAEPPAGDEAEPASPERGGVSEADEGVTPADEADPSASADAEAAPLAGEPSDDADDPVGDGVLDIPFDDAAVPAGDDALGVPAEDEADAPAVEAESETEIASDEASNDVLLSGACGDALSFELDSDGVLTISGTGAMADYLYESGAPWYDNRGSVKTAVIESGVTSIGNFAFHNCYNLTDISIPSSVTSIGWDAFYKCYNLTDVTIPSSVTSIGSSAFEGCRSLTSVTVPGSVTSLAERTFKECSALASVTLGAGMTEIGCDAFYKCSSLTSITIPGSMTGIGGDAFFECTESKRVYITDLAAWCKMFFSEDSGNPLQGGGELYLNGEKVTELVIPADVTRISSYAFRGCSGFTSVTIPANVTSVGRLAFSCCGTVREIHFGHAAGATLSIGSSAFSFCDVTAICVPDPNNINPAIEGYDWEGDYCTVRYYPADFTVPADRTESGASYSFDVLNAVWTVSGHTDALGAQLAILSELEGWPVTGIDDNAFSYCSMLTSVSIPSSVTSISYDAFHSCSALREIHFGHAAGATLAIDDNAFYANNAPGTALCVADTENVNTAISGYDWEGDNRTVRYYPADFTVPADRTESGVKYAFDVPDAGWTVVGCTDALGAQLAIPAELAGWPVTSIGPDAFYGHTVLTSVSIPSSVTSIGNSAFYGYGPLRVIRFGHAAGATLSIGDGAFCENRSLPTAICVPDPENVNSAIRGHDWAYDARTVHYYPADATIPADRTESGVEYFFDIVNACWAVVGSTDAVGAQLAIPAQLEGWPVTSIRDEIFKDCDTLTSVSIPSSVASIGEYAFSFCPNLTEIRFSHDADAPLSIGIGAFNSYQELNTAVFVTDPENVNAAIRNFDWAGYNRKLNGFSQIPAPLLSGSCGDDVTYVLDSEGLLTIAGTGAMTEYSSVFDVPWYSKRDSVKAVVIENGVTGIGKNAFWGCNALTSAAIPASVAAISEYAFYGCESIQQVHITDLAAWCAINFDGLYYTNPLFFAKDLYLNGEKLVNLMIPEGVTTIGVGAFRCCGVTSVTIPASVTSIGKAAFSDCHSLTSVTINSDTASIGEAAFCDCHSLTSVTIAHNITSIGDSAFQCCGKLESFTVPASVTSIGSNAFHECWRLKRITFEHSASDALTIGETAFQNSSGQDLRTVLFVADPTSVNPAISGYDWAGDARSVQYVVIGTTVLDEKTVDGVHYSYDLTADGYVADGYTDALPARLVIPAEINDCPVTGIGSGAFTWCSSLTGVTIPASVSSIGENAFYGCIALTGITVAAGNGSYCSDGGVLFDKERTTLIRYPASKAGTSYSIPNSVISIGSGAFQYSRKLTSVTIPAGVTSIGEHAFEQCDALTSAAIPAGVTSISDRCFYDCWSLTDVTIPAGVTSIGESAFYRCSSLNAVTIPENVTRIGWEAFGCCPLTSVTIPAGVTSFGGAFALCNKLTSVTICPGVTNVGGGAFFGCSALTSISFPVSVTSIGREAFSGCGSLKRITFEHSASDPLLIEQTAFEDDGQTELRTALFVEDPANIHPAVGGYDWAGEGRSAQYFEIGTVLPEDRVIDGVKYEFDAASNEFDVVGYTQGLPARLAILAEIEGYPVRLIGNNAFENCNSLTSVTIPASVTAIGSCAFSNSSITSVSFGTGLKSIGDSAFSRCTKLKSVVLPEGLESIGDGGFWSCSGMTSIVLPESLRSIGNGCFCYVGLKSVTIPGGVTDFGAIGETFCNSALESVTISEGMTTLGKEMFSGCEKLKSVSLPSTLRSMGSLNFCDCIALAEITIPEGLTDLSNSSFARCRNLKKVTIPNTVTRIGNWCFTDCTALTEITIPESVTQIDGEAFLGCSKLTAIRFAHPADAALTISPTAFGFGPSYSGNLATFVLVPDPANVNPALTGYDWAGDGRTPYFATRLLASLKPAPSSVANTATGVTVKWSEYADAVSYVVYRKVGTAKSWSKYRTFAAGVTSFTDTSVKAATKYAYTIQVVGNGQKTGYHAKGKAVTYYPAPKVSSAASDLTGVTIKWAKTTGAGKYRVFRSTDNATWTKLGDTTAVTFTDKKAVSGNKYYYCVQALSSKGAVLSGYGTSRAINYVGTPKVPALSLAANGITVKWSAVNGATKYNVYRKVGTAKSWTKYKTITDATSFVDTSVKTGTKYAYTIQAIGGTTSKYNTTGKTITYYQAPKSVTATGNPGAVTVKWAKVSGAAKYRVFRRVEGGGWSKLGDTTAVSFKDKTAQAGVAYEYAVRTLNAKGSFLSTYSLPAAFMAPLPEPDPGTGNDPNAGNDPGGAPVNNETERI